MVGAVAASIGALLVFESRLFLQTLDAQTTPATLLLLRMLGGMIGGTSLVYFALRRTADRRLMTWLLITGIVEDGAMSFFFFGGLRDGVVSGLGWGVEGALVAIVAAHLVLLIVMTRTYGREKFAPL